MLAVTNPVAAALNKRCDSWLLRLDKFSFERAGDAGAKTGTLKTVRSCYQSSTAAHLQPASRRRIAWLDALQRQHGTRFGSVELVADSRLLLHLGRASVLENVGLYADHTTGLPLIPGTALKGVVSTWACWSDHFNPADGSFREFTKESAHRRSYSAEESRLARRILGDDSPTGSEHAGDVVFVGGFPLDPPQLGLDIVNPHHKPDGTVETRLTPSAFLCLEPGTRWRFAFFVRPGTPNGEDLLQRCNIWITEALTQAGIGAKIAAGYGRFRRPSAADEAAQQRQSAQAAAAEASAKAKAALEAERAKQQAVAQATLRSDYPSPVTFKNRVVDKLTPGLLEQLRPEIALLQKQENADHREELKKLLASKDYKDIRKRLRDKDWFPKEWLPAQ